MSEAGSNESPAGVISLPTGVYTGDLQDWAIELRVQRPGLGNPISGDRDGLRLPPNDPSSASPPPGTVNSLEEVIARIVAEGQADAISADLQRTADGQADDLYVKMRSVATARQDGAEVLTGTVDIEDRDGGRVGGELTLVALSATTASVQLKVHGVGRLCGLSLAGEVTWQSGALRTVRLAVHTEEGIDLPPYVELRAGQLQLEQVFRAHGVAVERVNDSMRVPAPVGGSWSDADTFAVLNHVVRHTAGSAVNRSDWVVHLLALSRSSQRGLFGVMFDVADEHPRQAAAIFLDEIGSRYPGADRTRQVLVTAAHEVGHAFNLTHRFNAEVGRQDSRSFMNYPWLYRGGNAEPEYWKQFCYALDTDEFDFLIHGARSRVIPGGDAFGSARYWSPVADAQGPGRVSAVNELRLVLTPASNELQYGQPVYLQVSLHNVGNRLACIPRQALDVKAGMLQIRVARSTERRVVTYAPLARRCYDLAESESLTLAPGGSVHNNMNVTLGSDGSPFAEPGTYTVTPELTVYGLPGVPVGVVRGESIELTVHTPPDAQAAEDGAAMLSSPLAVAVGLATATSLPEIASSLDNLATRPRTTVNGANPIAAAILRARGLAAARERRNARAVQLLSEALVLDSGTGFDPHTAHQTRRLIDTLSPGSRAPRAFLELVGSDGGLRVIPGIALSRPVTPPGATRASGEAVALLVSGQGLGQVADLRSATAVVTAQDGLVERVQVVDLASQSSEAGEPEFVLATLGQAVPTSAPTEGDPAANQAGELRGAVAVRALLLDRVPESTDAQLIAGEDAWLRSIRRSHASGGPATAPRLGGGYVGLDDVASKICDLIRICAEKPGPPSGKPDRGCWSAVDESPFERAVEQSAWAGVVGGDA